MYRAEQDSQFRSGALEILVAVNQVQMRLDVRVATGEFGQSRCQPAGGKQLHDLQYQRVFLLLAKQRGRGFVDRAQGLVYRRQECVTRIGQYDVTCTALEQGFAEVLFEGLDLLADRRRAHIQRFGRTGKVFHARGRLEHAQPVQ